MGLPAGLGLGVLLLPSGLLLLVAGLPLVGLRVEALGVDVVALLVVAVGHTVEGGVELVGGHVDTFVGLLQRQGDAAALQVDVDDLDHHLVANGDDLLRDLDVTFSQFGDVHQAFDAVADTDERTERNQLGDLAGHDLTDLVQAREGLPRIFLGCLQRQGHALAVHVHLEHLDGDRGADLHDLVRVIDVLPAQFGDVNQAVDPTKIHERAEVDDGGDHALADLALLQLVEEGLANLGLGLLQPGATRQHHVVAVLVQFDDLGLEFHADVGLEVADAAHLDQRCGQEPAQADVDDQTALDHLDDGTGDDTIFFLDLLDRAPGALVLGAFLGQDQAALLVLLLLNQGFDLVADPDHVEGIDVVLDGEFLGWDDTFGLVTDVEEDFIPVDLDDSPGDDVAVVEVLDGGVDGRHEGFRGTEIVDRYGRGLSGGGGHVVGLSQ